MNTTHRPTLNISASRRHLLVWAAVVAVSLLGFYVHVLQDAVQRGDAMRQVQRSTGHFGPMNSGVNSIAAKSTTLAAVSRARQIDAE